MRKIHIIVFSPSFEVVDKINAQLGWIGNLKSDGRPILGLDAKELVKIVLNVSARMLGSARPHLDAVVFSFWLKIRF